MNLSDLYQYYLQYELASINFRCSISLESDHSRIHRIVIEFCNNIFKIEIDDNNCIMKIEKRVWNQINNGYLLSGHFIYIESSIEDFINSLEDNLINYSKEG